MTQVQQTFSAREAVGGSEINSPVVRGQWGGGKNALGWETRDLLITPSATLGGCLSLSGRSFPTVKWAGQT